MRYGPGSRGGSCEIQHGKRQGSVSTSGYQLLHQLEVRVALGLIRCLVQQRQQIGLPQHSLTHRYIGAAYNQRMVSCSSVELVRSSTASQHWRAAGAITLHCCTNAGRSPSSRCTSARSFSRTPTASAVSTVPTFDLLACAAKAVQQMRWQRQAHDSRGSSL